MRWEKLGLIFDLKRDGVPWMTSRAMSPTPLLLQDRIRVFFSSLSEAGVSLIGFADFDRADPAKLIDVSADPLLDCGSSGLFDDSGTIANSALRRADQVWLYYTGYNRRVIVPWSNSVGLAISDDDGRTFSKAFLGPVIDRTPVEPYFVLSANVLDFDGRLHAWYASGIDWISTEISALEPIYVIKHGESDDGVHWMRDGKPLLASRHLEESTASPSVVCRDGRFQMWFCHRGGRNFRDGEEAYRIGYAESSDCRTWVRDDAQAGLEPGAPGEWDSQMQAYPSVIEVDGQLLMFYNGNHFGAEGFGCAVWNENFGP